MFGFKYRSHFNKKENCIFEVDFGPYVRVCKGTFNDISIPGIFLRYVL